MMLSHDAHKRPFREKFVTLSRLWSIAVAALVIALALLVQPWMRQWLGPLLGTVVILGGIIAAPIVTLVGWVGMVLPPRTWLHEAAPTFLLGALIWLAVAIVGAHMNARLRARTEAE